MIAPRSARHGRGGGHKRTHGVAMICLLFRGVLPLTLLLGGCDLGPWFQRPEVEMPVQFRATEASGTEAWPSEDWWRGFKSP